ncbi:hypothetical protein EUX98_g1413 [Antrodiella citrinella]|uniref:ATP-dependent RNA helicase n=1 Tax=Antrodiella citrinella TaxID=2447956 RepID=A0A4S4N1J2_9APHY|nr:hypothetical protein EUX98_g1413 [Antrodiella citrinella]
MVKSVPKRKSESRPQISRKKVKTSHLSTSDLPWKIVPTPKEAGLGDDLDGILELEEVDGIEVVYEQTGGGRVAKFNVVDIVNTQDAEVTSSSTTGPSTLPPISAKDTVGAIPEVSEVPFDAEELLPAWRNFSLHSRLLQSLYAQHFSTPTPIQSQAIPAALKGKDVVGVAETGSGKTLAYGLPILNSLLLDNIARYSSPATQKQKRTLRALILAPTRELALQVSTHLNACLNDVSEVEVKDEAEEVLLSVTKGSGKRKVAAPVKPRAPPLVSVAAVVGGMSAQKQRRVLDRGVDVMVATPGRLWDILQENDGLALQLKNLKFLVLDEADRMIETGHFTEMENILRLTLRVAKDDILRNPEMPASDDEGDAETTETDGMQTFVFSATLSKDLQRNLKIRQRPKKGRKQTKPASTLDDLVMRLDFRDPDPEVIDLSPEGGRVSSLRESKIDCLMVDKDAYLYYFLLRYPGRSLVFLSSIDGIRRLMPLMDLLEINAFPLHSQLEQRQRLKNLDRFKNTADSVLLATDIAARGLDIPSVDHVVHYQIPRSADVLLMCAPDEWRLVKALMNSLGREEQDIPEISMELYLLDKIKARIQLAKQIDNAQHKIKRDNHEKHWLREAADAMELEIDSDMGLSSDDDSNAVPSKHQKKTASMKTAGLKAELKQLLAQPLIARGVSTRYITSGSRPIVDDMITGEHHEAMVGLKKSQAGQDVLAGKRKKAQKVPVKAETEEWHGFERNEKEDDSDDPSDS